MNVTADFMMTLRHQANVREYDRTSLILHEESRRNMIDVTSTGSLKIKLKESFVLVYTFG